MERRKDIEEARGIFKDNFLGIEELQPFFDSIGISKEFMLSTKIPNIPYSIEELDKYSKDYILILGFGKIGSLDLSIRFLRNVLGVNPELSEPCFYNQDWYLKESFIDSVLENKWYLIRKSVFENSRAEQPAMLIDKGIRFPSATLCAYTFFANYFYTENIIWEYDFVWCSDTDHNGDRIYVGKYNDIEGVNKNGFSIHRHLNLRECYGGIDCLEQDYGK